VFAGYFETTGTVKVVLKVRNRIYECCHCVDFSFRPCVKR